MTRDQEIKIYFERLPYPTLRRDMYYHRGVVRYLLKKSDPNNKEYCRTVDKMTDDELFAEYIRKSGDLFHDDE